MAQIEVATKVIILNKNNEVLLLVRSKTDPYAPGQYDFPGGKLKFAETPLDGAKRETFEETGLRLDDLIPIRTWSFVRNNIHIVGMTFFTHFPEGSQITLSYEHSQYVWLSREKIAQYTIPEAMKITLGLLFEGKLGRVELF